MPDTIAQTFTVLNAMITFITALGAAVLAYLTVKKSVVGAVREEAKIWESLAAGRLQEIEILSKRISDLEQQILTLRHENNDLRAINLSLQKENFEFQTRIQELVLRVQNLELLGGRTSATITSGT